MSLLEQGIDPSNLSDEDLQMLMELGIIADEQTDLMKQIESAEALRGAGGPEGRYVANGRLYMAASPLEHLGSFGQKFAAHQDVQQFRDQIEANRQAQADARLKMAQQLRGPSAPPAVPGMTQI